MSDLPGSCRAHCPLGWGAGWQTDRCRSLQPLCRRGWPCRVGYSFIVQGTLYTKVLSIYYCVQYTLQYTVGQLSLLPNTIRWSLLCVMAWGFPFWFQNWYCFFVFLIWHFCSFSWFFQERCIRTLLLSYHNFTVGHFFKYFIIRWDPCDFWGVNVFRHSFARSKI